MKLCVSNDLGRRPDNFTSRLSSWVQSSLAPERVAALAELVLMEVFFFLFKFILQNLQRSVNKCGLSEEHVACGLGNVSLICRFEGMK